WPRWPPGRAVAEAPATAEPPRAATAAPAMRPAAAAGPREAGRAAVVAARVRRPRAPGAAAGTAAAPAPRPTRAPRTRRPTKPGATVSVAFGFMVENPSMGAHFAQIIRPGGPLWMFGAQTDGSVTAEVHRGSGGGRAPTKLEAMKWYDFRVDTVYSTGGTITFYMNGQMIGQGKGDGGGDARFDCGIYWFHGAKPSRTVYISNVSI